jgi:ankyrin repeat protein
MTRSIRTLFFAIGAAAAMSSWISAAGPTPVADAAMNRDRAAVRTLLKEGGDVNAAHGDGMTALHWAAMQDDAELAGMLLYAGANLRATTRLGGYTPLHLAVEAGAAVTAEKLLAAGADANASAAAGTTPLMLAAAAGDTRIVTQLLDKGADPNAKESAHGQTALMFAAARGRADVVSLLLARGADANVASSFVDLLALAGLDGEGRRVNAPAPAGQAPANQMPENQPAAAQPARKASGPAPAAAPRGNSRPPDVPGVTRGFRYNELIGRQGGLTPLHFAARQGHITTAKALIGGGAKVNLASPGDGTSPLLIAIINGHFDLAMYLLEQGADPTASSSAGATPLYAVLNVQWAPKAAYPQPRAYLQQQQSYLDVMKALLERGADPNVRVNRKVWYTSYNFDQSSMDEIGATPFWRAAYASDIEAMKLLVAHGADPVIPTIKPARRPRNEDSPAELTDVSGLPPVPVGAPGITPLQAAAGVGYGQGFAGNSHRFAPTGMLAAVQYVVDELGADVNAVDHEGNTALHHAAARGDNEMILYLVSKGADPKRVNRAGQTTVDMANGPVQRIEPFPETIALLEKLGARNNHKCVSC